MYFSLFIVIFGYILGTLIETPILMLGLSSRHSMSRRLKSGLWLTACTYPVISLVIPQYIDRALHESLYIVVAEIFAPAAECLLFWLAYGTKYEFGRSSMWQDFGVIVGANLASFAGGALLYYSGFVLILFQPILKFLSPDGL